MAGSIRCDGQSRRPAAAELRTPGKRGSLVPFRSRCDYQLLRYGICHTAQNAKVVSAAAGLDLVTGGIADRFFRLQNIAPADRVTWSGGRDPRDPRVRGELIYKARPLNGIWAVAPYLHNGSVPNLDALLSPDDAARPAKFWMGSKQYDSVKVGYDGVEIRGGTLFDTTQPGNSNSGHRFKDAPRGNGVIGPAFSADERAAIIEYLKSL
jgi:hypothetical protein